MLDVDRDEREWWLKTRRSSHIREKSKQANKQRRKSCSPYSITHRVMVDMLGRCLPIVGIPLFLPWLKDDDELRGIDDWVKSKVGVMSMEEDGGICSIDDWGNAVRRWAPSWDRTGPVNGLLLTSFSKPFSTGENCFAVKVEPKSVVGFLPFRCTAVATGCCTFATLLLLLLL